MYINRHTGERMDSWVEGVSIPDREGRLPPPRPSRLPRELRILLQLSEVEQDLLVDHLARVLGPRGSTSDGQVAAYLRDHLAADASEAAERVFRVLKEDAGGLRDLIQYGREDKSLFLRVSPSGLRKPERARRRW